MKLFLGSIVFLPILLFISFSSWLGMAMDDDCGGQGIAYTIHVDKNGGNNNGTFTTVQAAIDSIKSNNDRWVMIRIHPGIYTEKVTLPREKPCVILKGDSRHITTIKYGDHQQTDSSATFSSFPSNVVVSGITFKNSFNVPNVREKLEDMLKNSNVSVPAVAARVYGNKTLFDKCGFIGYQDTLFDATGRHFFKNCYIQGEVDFIFGYARSYYKNCVINVTQETTNRAPGFVTANGRNSSEDYGGFVFMGGRILGSGQVNLGRAWGRYSRVIFHRTHFGPLVTPQGWNAWHQVGYEDNLTYAEYRCTGPGNNTINRVPWEKKLNPSDIHKFSLASFINRDRWIDNLPVYFL